MSYDFKVLEKEGESVKEWLKGEYITIQTGSVTPAILDKVKAKAYGTDTPLPQIASINIEDPKTLLVSPFDPELVEVIETGIRDANLGVSISTAGTSIRVKMPEFTVETKEILKKTIKEKAEQARISIRTIRDKVSSDIKGKFDKKEISEDEKHTNLDTMEKIVSKVNEDIANILKNKEEEVK